MKKTAVEDPMPGIAAPLARWAAAVMAVLLAACGASAPPQLAAAGGSSSSSGASAADERDCLWALNSNEVNTLFPDTDATYWIAALPIPPGGAVRFDGVFPHARYFSFNLYNALLQPLDTLTDFQAQPAAGSTNPYPAGADRGAAGRNYSVRLVAGAAPVSRTPNTLYSTQTLGPVQVPLSVAIVVYRVYVPDHGTDASGGTGLPHIVFELPGGAQLSGLQACPLASPLSSLIPDLASIPDLLADVPLNTSAFSNLLWLKFFSLQSSEANRVFNTPLGPAVYELIGSPTTGGGGFLSNQDNRYVYAAISQQLGKVVAIHARFPIAPTTSDGRSPMGSGDMRYWSLCSNDPNTLAVFSCLYDEQLVRDAQGEGIVVVSKPADRPSNATAACGVTWLDWGINDAAVLIYRHMLPQPPAQFPNAIQYVPGPPGQHEAAVMGPYYPYGSHMAPSAFESLGCPVSASQLPSVVTPPP